MPHCHESSSGPRQPGGSAGFTLMELLVVLVILGLIAGILGPRVVGYLGGAKADTARLQIEELDAALDLYKLDVGRYPTSSEGLKALIEAPAGATGWRKPYLKKKVVPKDPWGNEYHYQSPGQHGAYDLYSYGADNREGGEDEDKDIVNWE